MIFKKKTFILINILTKLYIRKPNYLLNSDSIYLQNWALNGLQYRHDIHKDIQEHNIEIQSQQRIVLTFEKK